MHLLLLSLNYYPDQLGNAPILIGLAEGLVQRGHKVSVVCAFPHHETGRVQKKDPHAWFEHEHHQGVDIYRSFILPDDGGLKGKALNYFSFSVSSLLSALRSVQKVDLIFTPSPPITLGFVDVFLSRLWKIPYIYNLQDLFPEAAIRLGMLKNPWAIRGFQWMEKQVLHNASHLAVICQHFKAHARQLGVHDERISVIPNFTDTDLIHPQATSSYRARWEIDEDEIVVLFSGRMGYSQNLDVILQVWFESILPQAQKKGLRMRLVLVGDGQAQAALYSKYHQHPSLYFAPTQPRDQLSDLLALADIGIAPLKSGLSGTSVPSKILGLMAAGRPVVAQAEYNTDTTALIQECQCGITCDPNDLEGFAQAILDLATDHQKRLNWGQMGRRGVVERYSQESVLNLYETLFLKVIENHPA